jgi:hypothetical protein
MGAGANKENKEDTASTLSESQRAWRAGTGCLRRSWTAAGKAFPSRSARKSAVSGVVNERGHSVAVTRHRSGLDQCAAIVTTTPSFRKWMHAPNEALLLVELLRVTFVWPSSPAMGCSFRDGVLLFPVIDKIYFAHHPESLL